MVFSICCYSVLTSHWKSNFPDDGCASRGQHANETHYRVSVTEFIFLLSSGSQYDPFLTLFQQIGFNKLDVLTLFVKRTRFNTVFYRVESIFRELMKILTSFADALRKRYHSTEFCLSGSPFLAISTRNPLRYVFGRFLFFLVAFLFLRFSSLQSASRWPVETENGGRETKDERQGRPGSSAFVSST